MRLARCTSFLDGSAAGVPASLDLDAADRLPGNGRLLLSFDGSAVIAGIELDDEDVLEHDPAAGTWRIAYDGSEADSGWVPADLEALRGIMALK